MSSRMFRYLLAAAAIAQFAVPALPEVAGLGVSVGDTARADYGGRPPEQPIGVAFAIWGVIFALYAVFAAHALVSDTTLTRRIGPPLALAGALNAVWMLSTQTLGSQLLNYVLLFPIAWFSWEAARAFESVRGTGGEAMKLVADATTGLLAGWITIALAISTPLTIRALTGLGATDAPWPMLFATLAVAAGGALVFATYVSRSLWYFAALGWGVFCIALNDWFVTGMHPLAIVAAVAGYLILRFRLTRGSNAPMAWPPALQTAD